MAGRTVSTWSLHRSLGEPMWREVTRDDPVAAPPLPGGLPLLALPAELRRRGYDQVQICHFHLPTRAPAYLAELRAALAEAEVELDAVLIDDGDLTDPAEADAAQAWIDGWLEDAETLGARRARVVAGKQAPSLPNVKESARRLYDLATAHPGVHVVTENWLQMMPDAEAVLGVLERSEGAVGLLIDLGNWTGPDKYDQLAAVARHAETCHAKCHFAEGHPDADDFRASLRVLQRVGYDGPLALVYDGEDRREWDCLDTEQRIVEQVFG